ncbi:MAG: sugar transferase [Owenweeksia sp.]
MQRVIAAILLLLLLPVFFILGFLQLFFFPEIFFTQQRIGKNEIPFRLFKFRSMHSRNPGAPDIPAWGHFLRRTSLDEIPQLFNILRGDMNFVGPRPLLPEYLPLYTERQRKRHVVKPGLTGWAQVKGRGNLSWKEQFELDVWYVENRSVATDLKVIGLTVIKMLQASDDEVKIRPPFNGKN